MPLVNKGRCNGGQQGSQGARVLGGLARQEDSIGGALTREGGVKSKGMSTGGSHGRNGFVVAHERPRFMSGHGMSASRHRRRERSVRATPCHNLRIKPQQTGCRVFQPNKAPAGGNKRQKLPTADVNEGGCGQLGSLGRRQTVLAARVRDRADWRRTPRAQARAGKC